MITSLKHAFWKEWHTRELWGKTAEGKHIRWNISSTNNPRGGAFSLSYQGSQFSRDKSYRYHEMSMKATRQKEKKSHYFFTTLQRHLINHTHLWWHFYFTSTKKLNIIIRIYNHLMSLLWKLFFFSFFRNINSELSYGKGRQECNGGGVVFGWLSLEWPWFSFLWESINRPREGNWGHKPCQAATMLLQLRKQAWVHIFFFFCVRTCIATFSSTRCSQMCACGHINSFVFIKLDYILILTV